MKIVIYILIYFGCGFVDRKHEVTLKASEVEIIASKVKYISIPSKTYDHNICPPIVSMYFSFFCAPLP